MLTDKDSWLFPYLDDLAEEWEASGHTCQIANKETEINKANGAKFCFCLGFGQIVSDEFRSNFKNTLVVHESELPKGRGWAPMTWQILEGKNQIPVTLLEAENAVDSGQVYLREYIELKGTELNPDWRNLQGKATQRLCREWINTYPAVLEKASKQQGVPSFYGRRNKKNSELNPEKSIDEQFNLLRVVDNQRYPAFFKVHGVTFRLTIEKEST